MALGKTHTRTNTRWVPQSVIYSVWGRATSSQEKMATDNVAILLAANKIKDAVDMAHRLKMPQEVFGKLSKRYSSEVKNDNR